MILPEIGGRVQMAQDRTNGYHFVYYNRVIKPALVGLAGPWLSGGIEFNWPQHHRPSTFEPVDWHMVDNTDGSKTVWCSEIERMFFTKACFEKASAGLSEPTSAMYYNDQPPDMIFYQGLARQKLGRDAEARQIFQKLVDYGQAHLDDDVTMDYFAVSLPAFLVFDEDLNQRNRIHCHYVMGLGQLGLGNVEAARQHFNQVLALDANHQGAMAHRTFQMSE